MSNKMSMSDWVCAGLLALMFVAAWAGPASAADDDTQWRVGYMPTSYHFSDRNSEVDWNDEHNGVLIEARVGERHWVGYMNYDNSFYENSNALYLGYDYEVAEWLDVGYMLGTVSGYETYGDGPAPWGALTATVGGDHLKGRLIYIPEVVAAYQFILEF